MQKLEVFRNSLAALVGETPVHQSEARRKEVPELREERESEFLRIAGLLFQNKSDHAPEKEPYQRLTDPTDLLIHDHVNNPFKVQVQVRRSIVSDVKGQGSCTEILATYSTGETHSVFSVEKKPTLRSGKKSICPVKQETIARNRYGAVASNDEVLEGLRSIYFIAGKSSKKTNSVRTT